jgi:sulfur-oxidizing protein SoxX
MRGEARQMKYRMVAAALLAATAAAVSADEATRQHAEQVVRQSFPRATPAEWAQRMQQDEVQALCSLHYNAPPPEVAEKIVASQQKAIRYPADGKLMGNWKEGEKLASIGTGGHIGSIQPDPPDRKKGGNCYACHLIAPAEVAAGTIGPSLTGYGKIRGNSPESIKYTYEKIYNAQAYMPCSLMPRFGHNGWLTPEQVADTVAFLLDPESPVNK